MRVATLQSLAVLAFLGVASRPIAAQADYPDVTKQRTARLQSTFATGAGEEGAGLVVGVDGDDLLVATAYHVVGNRTEQFAQSVRVTFLSQREDDVAKASLLERDQTLDLAILRVRAPRLARVYADSAFLCARAPVVDEKVTTVGHPDGELWRVNTIDNVLAVTADSSTGPDTRKFRISGRGVATGSSGGPVLGSDGCLIGLILGVNGVESPVVRADQIQAMLSARNVTQTLLAGDSAPSLRLRRETFDAISKRLDGYLFQLEKAPAIYRRTTLLPQEIKTSIIDYNTAYHALMDNRVATVDVLSERFGRSRGGEFDALLDYVDVHHKDLVFGRLNPLSAAFLGREKLTATEDKLLAQLLPDIDAFAADAKSKVKTLLDALRPSGHLP